MRIPRSLAVLIGGTIALLVVGTIVAIAASRQQETTFPPDSPQGTVATYLRLLQNGQVDEAYTLTQFEGVPYPRTREQYHQQFDHWSQTPHRVTLVRSSLTGDRASVVVEISTFSADVFGTSDRTSSQTFTLVNRAGAWRITGPSYIYG